jgi:MFS family permease
LLSQNRPKLLNVFTLPLRNRKFMLTMLLYTLYAVGANLTTSVLTTWQLQDVKTGYVFPSAINVIFPLFVLLTSSPWSRFLQRYGNLKSLAMSCTVLSLSYFGYCFVDHSNYLWLLAIVRLVQHGIGMIQHFSVSNLIYLNLPKEDQTAFTSFHTIVANISVFTSMSLGTWVVAAMGSSTWNFLGHTMASVPTLLLAQAVILWLTSGVILLLRIRTEPIGRRL